jgi:hypothetical protein
MIPQNIGLEIRNITLKNRRLKFHKAIGELAKTLELRTVFKALPQPEPSQEKYLYPVQQELSDRWVHYFDNLIRTIYQTVVESLGLPTVGVETIRKATDDDSILRYNGVVLKFIPFYKGRVLYSPETGKPIQKKEFDALIAAIEKFLEVIHKV